MAGFPFQHTRRTNVTVMAAGLRAFVRTRGASRAVGETVILLPPPLYL